MAMPGPQPTWRDARCFADLLALARGFLEGRRGDFPGWGGRDLDEESDALLGPLLAANRAGLLTVASQPGRPFSGGHDGRAWGGRAFVGGFAGASVVSRLEEAAARAGLEVRAEGPGPSGPEVEEPPSWRRPVGLRDGTPYLVLGGGARALELEIFEDQVGEGAFTELAERSFLWALDPVWGRRSALPALLDAL